MANARQQKPAGAWNAHVNVTAAYFEPNAHGDVPALVRVEATALDGSWCSAADLPVERLTTAALRKTFPRLRFVGTRQTDLGEDVRAQLYRDLDNGSIRGGYVFNKLGAVELPSGSTVFVRGNKVIGEVGRPYILSDEVARYHLREDDAHLPTLVRLLSTVQLPALLALAFTLLASVRSLLVDAGISLQAVLLLEGKQGLGKTTLAERIAAVYERTDAKRPAGVLQLGSTFASMRDALLEFRDAAVVIDDLCLSASKATQRSSLETAARVMRMATGDIPLAKKANGKTLELYAQAMAVVTAEYTFDNMSGLTRCITVPISKQLHLPDALTPDLCGAAVARFSRWIADHHEGFIERMRQAARGEAIPADFDQRIRTNYSILSAVWDEFLLSLQPAELDKETAQLLRQRFTEALEQALTEHATLIEGLRANAKRGNLAYVIIGALESDVLRPGKKVLKDNDSRLERYQDRGCLWLKGRDLGVDPEVLLQAVRAQPGYHNATRNGIARELKDVGALILQRNGQHTTNLVKLWDGGPWGYRLNPDALEDEVKEF